MNFSRPFWFAMEEKTGGGGGGTPPPWYGAEADAKTYVEGKGFKEPTDLLASYRALEKTIGVPKERLVRLPEKADDKAGWDAVHTQMGRPAKAEEYTVAQPAGAPEGFDKWAKDQFFALGLSKSQGETLAKNWAEFSGTAGAKAHDGAVEAAQQQMTKLKTEWGVNFDANAAAANKVAAALGITKEQYQAGEKLFGFDGWAKHLHGMVGKFGIKFDEADFHGGGGGAQSFGGGMTADAARAQIQELQRDTNFVDKFVKGETEAVKKMNDLHKIAYPGMG